MKKDKHILYYLTLAMTLLLGMLIIAFSSPNTHFQFSVFVLMAFFYVFWGILHHLLNHELTTKIVIEYVLVGSFGIAIVFFLLKGGFGI